MIVPCPSGLSVAIRGLTGKDGRYLADRKLARDNEIVDYILRSCWVETVESGPYAFEDGKPQWGKVLIGDRDFVFMSVRVVTYPDDPFVFKLRCRECDRPFEWEIDVAEYLKTHTKRLSPEAAQTFKNGNRFESMIPGTSRKYWFKLTTGDDVRRMLAAQDAMSQKDRAKQNKLLTSLVATITEIEGVDKSKPGAKVDFLEELDMRTLNRLLIDVQEPNCGTESTIEVTCPSQNCAADQEVDLPLGQGFFQPEKRKKKKPATLVTEEEEESLAP